MNVIPASKRRRVYDTTRATGFVRSLRDMFERRQERPENFGESGSEGSDDGPKEIKDDKKEHRSFTLPVHWTKC